MENSLPKNRPSRRDSVFVSRVQFDHILTDAAAKKGDEIAKSLATLKDDIAPAADKTFVMMKNKQVWFDRNNAALFPKFESGVLQAYTKYTEAVRNYLLDFEGFIFLPMTSNEFGKSFLNDRGNPYLQSDGKFMHTPSDTHEDRRWILTEEIDYRAYVFARKADGNNAYWSGGAPITIVPIHRLRGKNAAAMNYHDAFFEWIKLGLVPEGLKPKHEQLFKNFIDDYSKIEDYVSFDANKNIIFDGEKFKADVLGGRFTEKIFGYDFDIRGTLDGIMDGTREYNGSVDSLKRELLECDHKRANIQPYEERLLTDINRGHWELFEDAAKDTVKVNLSEENILIARPPQLDVSLNGICAIDFGTKSTIVVCRDGDARMLRVGQGDYSKVPTMKDFENPTVIELRDVKNFLAAYRARDGRPFTEWNQVTVSHQAADAIFKENVGSSVYNSVFNELKQWARDEKSYFVLKDLNGTPQTIKPYLETKNIDADDFDPIELYAYYLGLFINNMHRQIYLDYILSFPVNYRKDIREHIRKSFENGLKKSLPPALLADEELMKRFRVYLGASEPAAYAVSALEGFGLEPQEVGEQVAYGVFDFGGGTTDFDFGIETVPENHRRNFEIRQFGFNGDVLLGGENILELLAYEVYKDNLQEMRDKKIPFALPAGQDPFAGAESLISLKKNDSNAHMNNRILSEKLRPIWENGDGRDKLTEDVQSVKLFSTVEQEDKTFSVNAEIKINAAKLEKCIEERIRVGVVNFFQSLESAFDGKEVSPIHIFLAGNSCRSPFVKKLFDEFISKEDDGKFILHMPLGMETSAEEKLFALAEKISAAVEKSSAEETVSTVKEISAAAEELDGAEKISELAKNIIATVEAERKINVDTVNQLVEEIKKFLSTKKSAVNVMELDRQRTGKTGVAFGLIRCRRGGKDVKIIDEDIDGDEMKFPYFLGDAGNDGKTFTVKIGKDVGYGKWVYFTFADEPEFEIYYTSEPRSLQGTLTTAQVKMVHCMLDDTSDDEACGVYVRKISPNQIEFAVGREEDFADDFKGKIYRQTL